MESKMKKTFLTIIQVLIFLSSIHFSFASEDHDESDHGHSEKFGADKAILKVDENKGFILSSEAFASLKIKTNAISRIDQIPTTAIVTMRDTKGIYVVREGFFKFIALTNKVKLQKNEQIVVSGQNLLLITDVYSKDETEYSH